MIQAREYGTSGPLVAVLHGGPGVIGYMAPVARRLGGSFRVVEPLQRKGGAVPLTVARHVSDLHDLVVRRGGNARPALVGHSWGAMLALVYAAAHPERVAALVLVGCGTFDPAARERLRTIRESRTDDLLRRRLERLPEEFPDPDARLKAMGDLILPLYSHDLASTDLGIEATDAQAFQETWEDMLRLQESGVYPAAFAAIDCPVIMLHGAGDPHPGPMIRDSLAPHLPQLEYHEWQQCGHYPWLERAVRGEFFAFLCDWIASHSEGPA